MSRATRQSERGLDAILAGREPEAEIEDEEELIYPIVEAIEKLHNTVIILFVLALLIGLIGGAILAAMS